MAASKMQRQVSPIPPGRYWISVIGPGNIADFDAWIKDMRGAVRVEAASLDRRGSASTAFIIFSVPADRAPFLNTAQFGFPNFAGPEVHTADDVRQGPDMPLEPLEQAEAAAASLASSAQIGGLLLVLVLLLALRR